MLYNVERRRNLRFVAFNIGAIKANLMCIYKPLIFINIKLSKQLDVIYMLCVVVCTVPCMYGMNTCPIHVLASHVYMHNSFELWLC